MSWNNVSLLTVNVNGIKKNGHLLIDNVLTRFSLCCIQETKFRDRHQLDTFQFNLGARFKHRMFMNDRGGTSLTSSTVASGGVMTILRSDFPGFDSAELLEHLSVPNHYIVVKSMVDTKPVYVHNVYAPVDEHLKQIFFENLPVDAFEEDSTHLVLGDLNTPINPGVDSSTGSLRARPGCTACRRWLTQLGVVDSWRLHHPEERVFTGPQPRRNRLDYILLSEPFNNALYGDSKYFEPKSAGDHLAHVVTLRSSRQLQGTGYWRFPQMLLEYPDVVSAIQDEARDVLVELRTAPNPGIVWERWKSRMKYQLQAVQRKIREQNEVSVLGARRTLELAAERCRTERDTASQEMFQAALASYRECIDRSSAYNQDTAFDHQVQNSETSSKHFFRAPDPSLHRVSIEEIQMEDNSVSTRLIDISTGFRKHWGRIMGDHESTGGAPTPPDQFRQRQLLDSIEKTLSSEDRDMLGAPVTAEELTRALKAMRGQSAPGLDGLPASFYQVAPVVFGECLEIVFEYQLTRGELLPSQRKSAVCMLHKKGARSDPGNYRPISLIGVDVKVLSKVLAYRLQSVLSKLIHDDQKAFLRGRSIHHHIRFMSDLQELLTAQDEEAYATFLDFEKAYDLVDWDYMFAVLERMGCGGIFANWVRLLYTRTQAHLLLNGHVQDPVFPTRGVKQGDPLSALLFLMIIEPLGNLLRAHDQHGIALTDDHTVTSVFFADDSTLLSSSVHALHAQLDLVQRYCEGSGARLNLSKCVVLPLNRNQDPPRLQRVRVLERSETVKFLGLPFGQEPTAPALVDLMDQRLFSDLRTWYRRARTLRGRLLVAQTMVLSRLWHYTVHTDVPDPVIRRWQAAINRFVLSRRYERDSRHVQLISKEFLYQPRWLGGLGFPNLGAALKRQKLQMVLQAIEAINAPNRSWTAPFEVLVSLALPKCGVSSPLDAFCIHPARHTTIIQHQKLPEWWLLAWRVWHQAKWPVTWRNLPSSMRLSFLMLQPIWFSAIDTLLYVKTSRLDSTSVEKRSLGSIPEPARSFRLSVAQTFQIRALVHFLDASGCWPSEESFARSRIDYRRQDIPAYKQFQMLRTLHREASQVLASVLAVCGVQTLPTPYTPVSNTPQLYVGVKRGERVHTAPEIPKSALLGVLWKPPVPVKPHPIQIHDPSTSSKEIKAVVKLSKRLRRILLPVIEDLSWRLAFRLLPARSRFSFLRDTNPDIVFCVHDGCSAIETEKHLFFTCQHASAIWRMVIRDWMVFFVTAPTWLDVVLGRQPQLRHEWLETAEIVTDIWHMVRCITLHIIWTIRNDVLYRQRTLMPQLALQRVIFTTLSAHLRGYMRRLGDRAEQLELRRVLGGLRMSRSLGPFIRANPALFRVRFK